VNFTRLFGLGDAAAHTPGKVRTPSGFVTRTPTTIMSTRRAQDYITTTLQVTRDIAGGTDKSTFTIDLPLDTPFDELDTLIKPIIDPSSTASAMLLLSVAVGQSLTFS
jgi:hypothetical protein